MKFFRVASTLGFGAVAALVACSSTTTTPTPTPGTDAAIEQDAEVTIDAGTLVDSTVAKDSAPTSCTPTPDAGASCNAIANTAPEIKIGAKAMALPTGTGGTIAEGRYYLTELSAYTGSPIPPGAAFKQTLELCAGIGQFVSEENGKPAYYKSFTYAPNGSQPNVTQTCSSQNPNTEIPYSSFTATPTTFTLFSSQFVMSAVYTKS